MRSIVCWQRTSNSNLISCRVSEAIFLTDHRFLSMSAPAALAARTAVLKKFREEGCDIRDSTDSVSSQVLWPGRLGVDRRLETLELATFEPRLRAKCPGCASQPLGFHPSQLPRLHERPRPKSRIAPPGVPR